MSTEHMTLGELHAALGRELAERSSRASWPVVVQLQYDGAYAKAYCGHPQFIHDHLPAPDGSDDIDNDAAFVVVLEGQIEATP